MQNQPSNVYKPGDKDKKRPPRRNKNKKKKNMTMLPRRLPKNQNTRHKLQMTGLHMISKPKLGKGHSGYQQCLADPFNYHPCIGVPSEWTTPTVRFHRFITLTLMTNASGNLCITMNPAFLSEASANTTFYFNNDVTNTALTAGSNTKQARVLDYQVGNGTVSNLRLVSAGMRVYSQSSVLNKTGVINACLFSSPAVGPTDAANITALPLTGLFFLPAIENNPNFNTADISCGEAIQLVWTPLDAEDVDFIPTENTQSFLNNTHDSANFVVVVQSAPASSSIKVDLAFNFEVVPQPGSVLNGMESIYNQSDKRLASIQASEFRNNHKDLIIRTYKSHNSLVVDPRQLAIKSNSALMQKLDDYNN